MPNLSEYFDKIKTVNEKLKNAANGIELMRTKIPMSWEDNTKGKYKENNDDNVLKENSVNENYAEKEVQKEEIAVKNREDNNINVDFNETNLAQAFIYSEIFGKPKSLRRGR